MAKDQTFTFFNFHYLCYSLFTLSTLSSISFLYWSHCSKPCEKPDITSIPSLQNQSINLLSFPSAWNHLQFPPNTPPKLLKIALFVKRWPHQNLVGGLERHALTLHLSLARRGHELHIFTTSSSNISYTTYPKTNISFHLFQPSPGGYLDQAKAWEQFQIHNSSGKPFDVIHTESVSLRYTRARKIPNVVVSWHGIAYETIHSDIVQDLLRSPEDPRLPTLMERLPKVIEEVKFFPNYAHHVATSDHVGDVLKRIYMIPDERVHIILNGIDEDIYTSNPKRGHDFKVKFGVPEHETLVIGMAGRLVKDKGHPIMYQALKEIFTEKATYMKSVFVLIAGEGPWAHRYRDLGSNVIILGALDQTQLAGFYNSLDVFVNPTLRAQGLDHTLLEAMMSGVTVMGTRFASITGSLIVGPEIGYTFLPTVASLKKALNRVIRDGRDVLSRKGEVGRQRAMKLFTATKMVAAYERLFLCMSEDLVSEVSESVDYCRCQLPSGYIGQTIGF
ncbi:hypothetical protein QJS10_CPB14g01676 [Acorus calamus]|uniref:Glycosyltransferase subfamily 4-like N-terminal domain-containing protein n=1 Tax=Acorus calamus TaxID=4465 RepID=A0AAV9DCS3_ACOCL|nr:hypothetical protein QJS10_CPB14g01676 [Acorus calamus]